MTGSIATAHDDEFEHARELLNDWLARMDDACNRFRPDSEISRINEHPMEALFISDAFARALGAALAASRATQGLCDPTVLPALLALGYDVDYDELRGRTEVRRHEPLVPLGVEAIHFDEPERRLSLTPGCQLDLGASAKALVADLVASDFAGTGGIVVEIGGDVAIRGAGPDGPWAIGISDQLTHYGNEPRIGMTRGGVATSSLTTRTWLADGTRVNHVIDPRTGSFATGPYATASVAADSCVMANAFATAALLWGEDAAYHVAQAGYAARLVRHDGALEYVGGWPREEAVA